MRTLLVICLFSVTGFLALNAQVKIGENPQTIDAFSLLELESGSRTLVITRVNDAQMTNMSPLRGAMVYNTDQSCVFYYNGTDWNNLCQDTTNISLELDGSDLVLTDSAGNSVSVTLDGAIEQTFTTDPIINFRESIVITQNGNSFNFEVSEITGENIVDSSINGVDLQDNSITANKLAPNSVGQEELQDNTVTDLEIDYSQVTLSDFFNDPGFITSAQLISPNLNNAITDDNGAFYDDSVLQTTLANTSQDLADHLAEDNDFDPNNERLSNIEVDDTELVFTEGGSEIRVDLSPFSNSGTDDQNLDEVLTQGNDAGGSTIANLGTPNVATDAATKGYVDDAISTIPAGSDNQELTLNGNLLTLEDGGAPINLAPFISNGSETIINPGTNVTITGDGTAATPYVINATPGGGGADGVISLVELNGTDLEFTGAGGGFNGTVPLAGLGGGGADGVVSNVDFDGSIIDFTGANGGFDGEINVAQLEESADILANTTLINNHIAADGDTDNTDEFQDLEFNPATNILTITNPATPGNEVDLSSLAGGGGSTEEADQTTIIGVGTNVDPFRIAPGPDGQYLSTTGGVVTWANLPTGTGGTVDVDGVTIEGNGVTPNVLKIVDGGVTATQLSDDAVTTAKIGDGEVQTDDIADANVTEQKISPSVTDGQVLTTVAGAVQWSTPTATGIVTTTAFTGDGTVGNELDLADDAVTTAKILDGEIQTDDIADANVTEQKISPSVTDGQVLTTVAGTVQWSTPTATGIVTTTAFTGDGTVGNELDLADDAVTTAKILDGEVQTDDIADANVTEQKINPSATDGQVLTTIAGAVQWSTPTTTGIVTTTAFIGDGTVGNELDLADDAVTTTKILDGEVQTDDIADDNVTPAKIEEGADGQVLITNGTDVQWGAAPAGASVTGPTIDGDGTVGNPLELADDAVTTAKILDGQVQTPDIADDNVTPAKIEEGADGQVLITSGTDVQWGAAPAGASVTGPTIEGDGTVGNPLELADDAVTTAKILDGQVQTPDIADDNVTPAKIEEGADGQVLITNGTDVQWGAAPAGASVTGPTIDGDGTVGNPLELADGAVTTAKILDGQVQTPDIADDNVTPAKIQAGADGQVLITNGIDVQWGAAPAGASVTGPTIDGDGTVGNPLELADGAVTTLKILDDNVTVEKIAAGTDGQVLFTDAVGDVVWATPTAGGVDYDNSTSGLTAVNVQAAIDEIAGAGGGNPTDEIQTITAANGTMVVTPIGINYELSVGTISGGPTGQIATNSITQGDIDFDAVGAGEIISGAVSSDEIADLSIQNIDIANATIESGKLAPGADGQVLTTVGTAVQWQNPAPGGSDGVVSAGNIVANTLELTRTLGANVVINLDDLAFDTDVTSAINNLSVSNGSNAPGEVQLNNGAAPINTATINVNDADFDPNNEIQDISLANGNELSITGGSTVILPSGGAPDWSSITNRPAGLDDGDDDTIYTASDGITLTGTNFTLNTGFLQGGIDDSYIAPGANIAGSKINPAFTADVSTTGNLTVGGTVTVQGVQVHPDYVFQKYFLGFSNLKNDYDFLTLGEIEAFIKKYHHLPGIQSAEELEEQGYFDLGKSSKLNLEKIEELFLHTIEQEKKIQSLKAENEKMVQEMEALKKDMELIKQMLLQKSEK